MVKISTRTEETKQNNPENILESIHWTQLGKWAACKISFTF